MLGNTRIEKNWLLFVKNKFVSPGDIQFKCTLSTLENSKNQNSNIKKKWKWIALYAITETGSGKYAKLRPVAHIVSNLTGNILGSSLSPSGATVYFIPRYLHVKRLFVFYRLQ